MHSGCDFNAFPIFQQNHLCKIMDLPVIEVISVVIIVKIITAAGIKHKKYIIFNIGHSQDFPKKNKKSHLQH